MSNMIVLFFIVGKIKDIWVTQKLTRTSQAGQYIRVVDPVRHSSDTQVQICAQEWAIKVIKEL